MRKTFLSVAAIVALTSGCSTMLNGPRQTVTVASSPTGATVLVDGRERGLTPLTINVPRHSSPVIRLERPGHEPYEARLGKQLQGGAIVWMLIGNWWNGWIPGIVVDVTTGSIWGLRPDHIDARLVRADH